MLLELPVPPWASPIRIKLYPGEARLLRGFLIEVNHNVATAKGAAPDAHFVLTDWLNKYFGARSVRIEMGTPKIAKGVEMPVSVARILMKEMMHTVIPVQLNIVLGQIHRELTNRNLVPL